MTDYEKYLDAQAKNAKLKERVSVDEIIYIQNEQHLFKGSILKVSEKSVKVKVLDGPLKEEIKNFGYSKIIKEGDCVALIWEAWRGNQGRGGYRIEREDYDNLRYPIELIPPKTFLCEEGFHKLNKIYEASYVEKMNAISELPRFALYASTPKGRGF